jgi:hypothetical protein
MLSLFWIFVVFVAGGTAGILLMALLGVAGKAAEDRGELRGAPASRR